MLQWGSEAYFRLQEQDLQIRKALIDSMFKQREDSLNRRGAAGEDISDEMDALEREKATTGAASGAALDKKLGALVADTVRGSLRT